MKTQPNVAASSGSSPSSCSQLLRIKDRASKINAEARQILIDAMHWNECVRKENEEKINADPDGSVERTIAYTADVMWQCDEKLAALDAANTDISGHHQPKGDNKQ